MRSRPKSFPLNYIGNRTEVTLSFHAPQESIAGLSNSGCPAAPLEVQDSSKSNDLQMYKRLMGKQHEGTWLSAQQVSPTTGTCLYSWIFSELPRLPGPGGAANERAKWQALSRDTPKRGP